MQSIKGDIMTKQDRREWLWAYIVPGFLLISPAFGVFGWILFFVGCFQIFIDLSYQGFVRQSRFALSRYHPILNFVFNIFIMLLPFTVFLFHEGSFIFIPVLIGLHIFSEIRSPDLSTLEKPKFRRPAYKYVAWLVFYFVGLAGGFVWGIL